MKKLTSIKEKILKLQSDTRVSKAMGHLDWNRRSDEIDRLEQILEDDLHDNRVKIYCVGDGWEYGLELFQTTDSRLVTLVNNDLKSKGMAIVKTINITENLDTKMMELRSRCRQGLADGSMTYAVEQYYGQTIGDICK